MALPEQTPAPGNNHPWDSSHEMQSHAQAAKRQAAPYSTMSRTSVASSAEPFSDDDDVTILDTTEVKKLSPQPLMPLLEGQHPEALPQTASHRQHGQSMSQEAGQRMARTAEPVQQPFHHYSLSPQLIESGSADSPGAAARYGHLNRMYATSTSDQSNPAAHAASQHHSQHSPEKDGSVAPAVAKQPAAQPGSGFQHHSSIYDSTGSQQRSGINHSPESPIADQQHFFDIIEDAGLAPQMRPGEFREMIDGIMAMSEKQAQAQLHTSGGAAALHPIWENEEVGNKR